MDKMYAGLGALALSILALVGIYTVRRSPVPTHAAQKKAVSGAKRRIAIMIYMEDPLVLDIAQGAIDTLEKEADFPFEVTKFSGQGDPLRMKACTEEAVAQDFDLMISLGCTATQLAKQITEKREKLIPVVFAATGDAVDLGIIASAQSSGNHLTGACVMGTAWADTMADLFPVLMPGVKHVLIPYDPTCLGGLLETHKEAFVQALKRNGITTTTVKIYRTNEVVFKMTAYIDACDVVLGLSSQPLMEAFSGVAKLCQQRGKGLVAAQNTNMLAQGACLSYGYHKYGMGVAVAQQIQKILGQGIAPTDIPINQMNEFYKMCIRRDHIQALGMEQKFDQKVLSLMEKAEVR